MTVSPVAPPFQGVGAALVTLFEPTGNVDDRSTVTHAAGLVKAGMKLLLVNGTTAESAMLSTPERLNLVRRMQHLRTNRYGVALVSGVTGFGAESAKGIFDTVDGLLGKVDGLLVPLPVKVTNAVGFYEEVARRAGSTPILAYNVPASIASDYQRITPELLVQLPVAGVKDSTGDAELLAAEAQVTNVYVGSTGLLAQCAALPNGAGALLGIANAYPQVCLRAWGTDTEAAAAQGQLTEIAALRPADVRPVVFTKMLMERAGEIGHSQTAVRSSSPSAGLSLPSGGIEVS